jgi:uncharacterized membrane protein YhaH (DUF805 family)
MGLGNTRLNRATYWLGLFVLTAIAVALSVFGKHAGIAEIVLFYLCVPRLHDIGLSGWWFGGALLLEIAVAAGTLLLLPLSEFPACFGFFGLAAVCALIWLGAKRGDPNANRFGEPPSAGLSLGKKAQPMSADLRPR